MIGDILGSDQALWLTKLVHIAAIAVWSGGLLSLPFLIVQRSRMSGDALHRLHRTVRYLHVQIVSPAAFAAVLAGMVLIFMREVFLVWFSTKLYFVAGLVACHVAMAHFIRQTFERDRPFGAGRAGLMILAVSAAVTGILFFVLAKPFLPLDQFVGEAGTSGWLRESFVGPVIELLISLTR